METTLKISGMHCPSCSMLLSDVINDIKGAKAIKVDDKVGQAKISYDSDATLSKIKQAIKAEGYKV